MEETWLLPLPAMLGVVVAVIAVLAVVAFGLTRWAVGRLTAGESWRSLAARYGTDRLPPPGCLSGRTLEVGNIRFRRCVIVGVETDGLFIAPTGSGRLCRRQPLLVPWTEFAAVQPARLYWQDAARISLGSPVVGTLVVPRELFEKLRERLPPGLRRTTVAGGRRSGTALARTTAPSWGGNALAGASRFRFARK